MVVGAPAQKGSDKRGRRPEELWSLNSNNHQRPPHMNGSTLKSIVSATLSPAVIEKIAAKHALVQRAGGLVCSSDLVLSLCVASCIGPDRSIAEARRQWELITGRTIARSSFDAHFDKVALGDSIWDLLRATIKTSNRMLRRQWPSALRDLFDVLIDDGSRARLRRKAKEEFPATDEDTAGVKLMARMSLGECKLIEASVGAARTHDHALRPRTKLEANVLCLRDLGWVHLPSYDAGRDRRLLAEGAEGKSRRVRELRVAQGCLDPRPFHPQTRHEHVHQRRHLRTCSRAVRARRPRSGCQPRGPVRV